MNTDSGPDLIVKKKHPVIVVAAIASILLFALIQAWYWFIYEPIPEPQPCDSGYTEMHLIKYQPVTDGAPLPRIEVVHQRDRQWYVATLSYVSHEQLLAVEKDFKTICVRPLPDDPDTAVIKLPY
jgi:hypothetical protein